MSGAPSGQQLVISAAGQVSALGLVDGMGIVQLIQYMTSNNTSPTINNDNEPPISFSLLYIINCTLSLTLSSYFQTGTTLLTSHCKIFSVLLLHTRPDCCQVRIKTHCAAGKQRSGRGRRTEIVTTSCQPANTRHPANSYALL